MMPSGAAARRDVSLSRLFVFFNTVWTERWWTQVQAVGELDWQRDGKSSLTLEFEGDHRLTREWLLWVRPGVGVLGRDVIGAYEWNVESAFGECSPPSEGVQMRDSLGELARYQRMALKKLFSRPSVSFDSCHASHDAS